MRSYYVYILECADQSYYIGITNNMERRLAEHDQKISPDSYTASRLPVALKYVEEFQFVDEALNREKQLKGWSRKKKQSLIQERWDLLREHSRNHASTSSA